MSIALRVSFPSYSPCYLSVFIWLNSACAQHLESLLVRGVSHWITAFPSPEQAVLSHSISLPHNTPSLAYTSTRAHSALFRFCLCFPHKSLSELDCMFVSSAASTEKWEAGGLQRCDCYAVRVHCVHVCSIRPRYSVGDEMNRGESRCLGLECLLQPETILGRRERTVWEGCIDRVNEEECVVKLICLWSKILLQS